MRGIREGGWNGAARRRPALWWCAALVAGLALGLAQAATAETPARTPSPPGAKVYFVDLRDGAHIAEKVTLHFGLTAMGVAPAGTDKADTGHHHLIIDAPLPPLDQPIPNDPQHLHFGAGQTEAEISLSPGPHTLQLLLGDRNHVPHDPPVASEVVHVVVEPEPEAAPAGAADASAAAGPLHKQRPADAKLYFVSPRNGETIYPNTVVHFGLTGMGIAPAGDAKAATGHHHLLIDAPVPPFDLPIPNDPQHLHFGAGQTETKLSLSPGPHTLQLILGDENHLSFDPPLISERIRVVAQTSAAPKSKRRGEPRHAAPLPPPLPPPPHRRPPRRPHYPYPTYRQDSGDFF